MRNDLNDYCQWTCTGTFEKSETLKETSGTPYRLVKIATHMGTITMFVGNVKPIPPDSDHASSGLFVL